MMQGALSSRQCLLSAPHGSLQKGTSAIHLQSLKLSTANFSFPACNACIRQGHVKPSPATSRVINLGLQRHLLEGVNLQGRGNNCSSNQVKQTKKSCSNGRQVSTIASSKMDDAPVEKVDVAIIGGGPAGLATAKGITRASPELTVRVFERASLRPRGASVFIVPNGMHALQALDPQTHAKILELHSPAGATVTCSKTGDVIGKMEGDSFSGIFAPYGPSAYVLWASLQRTLADSLPPGVLETELRLGDSSVHDEGDHIKLQIVPSGRQAPDAPPRNFEAQIVIGADGNQSALRTQVLGDGPPKSMGVGLFRALLKRPDKWIAPNEATTWAAQQQAFRTAVFQGNMATWTGIVPWPKDEEYLLQGRAYISGNDDGGTSFSAKERCLQAFEGWPEAVRGIIEATEPESILLHAQNYREPDDCKVWGRGRATLVGDAAHLGTPLLSQGTSQAFEDALELSRSIRTHGPTPEALRAYERVRQPLAQPIQSISVDLFQRFQKGETFPPDNEAKLSIEHGFVKRAFEPLLPV